jgi:hypothetical protein
MRATKVGHEHTIVSCLCLVILILLMALPVVTDAGAPAAPGSTRTMMKSTGIVYDFQSPAGPQDLALVQSVSTRLESMGSTKTQSAAPAGLTDPGSVRGRKVPVFQEGQASFFVTVDARNGHVRLGGKNLTPQQRIAVEHIVRSTAGVQSWDWGN